MIAVFESRDDHRKALAAFLLSTRPPRPSRSRSGWSRRSRRLSRRRGGRWSVDECLPAPGCVPPRTGRVPPRAGGRPPLAYQPLPRPDERSPPFVPDIRPPRYRRLPRADEPLPRPHELPVPGDGKLGTAGARFGGGRTLFLSSDTAMTPQPAPWKRRRP